MNVLAQTADDVGIEKFSQFVREIHTVFRKQSRSFEQNASPARTEVPVTIPLPEPSSGSLALARLTGSKDRNHIAHGNEFLHPCGVPVGGANATVTGRAADGFGLVGSVNTDMRFA